MSENFACRRSLCRVQTEEGGEQGIPSGSQERKLGSENVPCSLGGAREAE